MGRRLTNTNMAKIFKTRKEAEDYYRDHPSSAGDKMDTLRPKVKRQDPEHKLQVRCVDWFDENYPNELLFAIPNGGKRHKAVAAKLKAEGVRAGIPDLMLARPTSDAYYAQDSSGEITTVRPLYPGLFIEMKIKPNGPTPEQKQKLKQLKEAGYLTAVVYTFEQFQKEIRSYLNS